MANPEDTKKRVASWTEEYHEAMLAVAMPFADATHGPEDIVSIACVEALGRHAEADDVVSPRRWMVVITRSVALQVVRKRTRRAELRKLACPSDSSLFEFSDQEVHREWQLAQGRDGQRDQVLEIAQGLSRALRQVVRHILVDGWGDHEIASRYGIKQSAVRQRRKRAIKAILGKLPPPPRCGEMMTAS